MKILLIDENQNNSNIYNALNEKYDIVACQSMSDAIEKFEQELPEIVITDYNIPGGTGTQLCTKIRKRNPSKVFSVCFFSESLDPKIRLAAFQAGAIDFIRLADCSENEIVARIERLEQYHLSHRNLAQQHSELEKAFYGSMRDAAYYGEMIQLMKRLMSCSDEAAIARAITEHSSSKQMNCSIQFRPGEEVTISYNQNLEVCTPIEVDVFELLKDRGRIFEFSNRIIFNDGLVSLLVKNLPDDEIEVGRIRDHLANLIEVLGVRYLDVLKHRVLFDMFGKLSALSSDMSVQLEQSEQQHRESINDAALMLQSSFHSLDLNEIQEQEISDIIQLIQKSSALGEVNTSTAITQLQHLAAEIKPFLEAKSTHIKEEPDSFDTVELF